ncbi:hypothetical protein NH340_JMT04882 [Sarcoptes scabiei]|nr:hypothetical protein NH340_JMT04882 [Sarcoptes scabiei]
MPKLVIREVNCGSNYEFCHREDIKQIPTIRLYYSLGSTSRKIVTYPPTASYDLESLQNFFIEKIIEQKPNAKMEEKIVKDSNDLEQESDNLVDLKSKNGLYELTDDDSSLFLSKGLHFVNFYAPWCSHCQNLAPKWEMLASLEKNRKFKISQIDCSTNIYTCKVQFKIKEYPTLLWIYNGKVITRYKGQHEFDSIKNFAYSQLADFELNKMLRKYSDTETEIDDMELELQKKLSNVQQLNQDSFKLAIGSGNIFIHFTVPWSKHCQKMRSEWDRLSLQALPSNIQIGKVDCSVQEKLCLQEKIDSYPTLYFYLNGRKLSEYDGKRDVDSFLRYLHEQTITTSTNVKQDL